MATPSLLDSIIRSAASGATFDAANKIAAAGDATVPLDGGSSTAPTWLKRYAENLRLQQQRDAQAKAQHGNAWQVGDVGGQMMNPAFRYLPMMADTLGLSSNVPSMLLPSVNSRPDNRPKDGVFGPNGLFSRFGGY